MRKILILIAVLAPFFGYSQIQNDTLPIFDYSSSKDFEIGGITVEGAEYSDDNAVIGVTGLKVGAKIRIPGPVIPKAIKSLWKLRLFTDVQIIKEKTIGDVIFLRLIVKEQPRLFRHSFKGAKKSHHDDLNEIVDRFLPKGGVVTSNAKTNAKEGIREYYVEKGYLDAKVDIEQYPDSSRINSVRLVYNIDRGPRVKIADIVFTGNKSIKARKLRKKMKNTKRKKRLFASSKYIKKEYEEDKKAIIDYYNTVGYRDARIVSDSTWRNEKGHLILQINLEEGNPYYFNNITWKGNSIYDTKTLQSILGIEKGDVYNQELLNTRLSFSQEGRDVSTLYMDNGYLFFRVDPIETAVYGDSIDLEIRIFEGPQATIDKVVIKGNDRTHEHVIRRELRTMPGKKFSRTDIIRSQRQLMNLGYFNPEALGINTPVNPQRGTVDIEYDLEERPSDQLELSAGWGGYQGVIGTLGVSFNNFSIRNIFNKKAWQPVPMGDGQRLSIRAQSNGRFYQSYNLSFTEPWLGGKKPTSLSVGGFFNRFQIGKKGLDGYGKFDIINGSVSLGTRLNWPDDNFIYSTALNLQSIVLDNYFRQFQTDAGETISNGAFRNFSLKQTLTRTTINEPIFPQEGSKFSLSLQMTLPYSLFNKDKDYAALTPEERYKWLEYHKWRFDAEWYTTLTGKLVLKAAAKFGLLGFYNKELGTSPFERFKLGGDGINNNQYAFTGEDLFALRGYEVEDLPANKVGSKTIATPVFNKFTVELRYPISLNPSSTIYVLAFMEAGNSWRRIKEYNPFDVKRSVGVGARVFLPMFGLLGFDYGIGLDKDGSQNEDQGYIRNHSKFSVILGFEPE